jgi:hypothetical protein
VQRAAQLRTRQGDLLLDDAAVSRAPVRAAMPAMLKTLERSATVAWCPAAGGLLAAGTVAGAIDPTFSTNSVLEVRQGSTAARVQLINTGVTLITRDCAGIFVRLCVWRGGGHAARQRPRA